MFSALWALESVLVVVTRPCSGQFSSGFGVFGWLLGGYLTVVHRNLQFLWICFYFIEVSVWD